MHPDSPAERFARQRRRNWARLLKKIYEVDPLTCPRCGHRMQIIAFIEEWGVIRKILQHLNLWEHSSRSPPPPPPLAPQTRSFPGHPLSPPGSTGASLHRFRLLGRRPRLSRLKSRGSSALVDIPASAPCSHSG